MDGRAEMGENNKHRKKRDIAQRVFHYGYALRQKSEGTEEAVVSAKNGKA